MTDPLLLEQPDPAAKREIIVMLACLIRDELGLEQDQSVIYNQDWKVPSDDRLYVSIAYLNAKPFGYSKTYLDVPTTPTEGLNSVQTLNVRETYSITVYSNGPEARVRKDEINFAFFSDAAECIMAANAFRIANLPLAFVDVSNVEGGSRINRYEATFNVLAVHTRCKPVPFYDQFTVPPEILVNP